MQENLDKIKGLIEKGKEKYRSSMSNPNIRAAIIGSIAFVALLAVIIIVSIAMTGKDDINTFVKTKWANALERNNKEAYEKLWEKDARKRNKKHYERVKQLLDKDLKVERDKIKPVKDFRNENLFYVKEIPVSLTDSGVEVLTYHDLTIEKKGWFTKWKILDDDVYFIEEDTPPIVQAENSTTRDSINSFNKYTNNSSEAQSKTSQSNSLDPIDGNAPLDTKLKISQVIGEWQVAWQEQDLDKYLSKYSDDAIITRVTVKGGKEFPIKLTKKEFRKRMEVMNKRYKTIQVKISDLNIDGDKAVADVEFKQEFIGTPEGNLPIYSDIGTKTLTFMVDSSDGYWKIYEENWKLYEKVPKYPKL